MVKVGIICEYNPFHNGHKYHIDKIKEMFPDSMIILAMSSCFTQRGDISIINKWDKTKIALDNNVDLVVEIPTKFVIQSADTFAKAVDILNYLDCDYLVFGSELNDIDKLNEICKIQSNDSYIKDVKKHMKNGTSYKNALFKALKPYGIDDVLPNDTLGISYIKEINKIKSKIIPITIKRTNDYNSDDIEGSIISANAIRDNINKIDIKKYVPKNAIVNYYTPSYFELLKYKIISDDHLEEYNLVDEGIENRLKRYINESNSIEELIDKVKSKRYTVNKLKRMFISILLSFKKKDNDKTIKYIRVLGFNTIGQKHLNSIKKNIKIPIYTKFNKDLEFELKTTNIYSMIVNDKELNKKELSSLIR
ncbi:MAG: nucleotidyltransferase [Bacilli bacterium]|nr:nucleotidyltransferase [Bacilli bacterium]